MRILSCSLAALLALTSCSSTETGPVMGRLRTPGIAPSTAQVYTTPIPGGGVSISTDLGQGQRAIAISDFDTARLASSIESSISGWSRLRRSAPFSETVMGATAGFNGANPLLVQLTKTPQMVEPVFLLTVGYRDATASLVLDKENAATWARRLREASKQGG